MVAVEVVARDHQGHPMTGLTAEDFQVSEQIAGKREQHPQKIAAFRAVSVAEIAAQDKGKLTLPAGVYTNLVTMDKAPVPPTVLLVDGLNTDRASQMQVHRQMIKMLASIPDDVPVDYPNALSALLEDTNFPAASLAEIEQFEREVYATQMDAHTHNSRCVAC